MTVAVVVKVFDGLVLAADSATTIALANGGSQVYNNANKVFHLHRRLPIGGMTWGLGQIGSASISSLAKDLRRRLMGEDPDHLDWELNDGYTLEEVANRLVEMFFDELYSPLGSAGVLGFLVAGYSGGQQDGEAWLIEIGDAALRPAPSLLIGKDQSGFTAFAQPDAADRLFRGYDDALLLQMQTVVDPSRFGDLQAVLNTAHRQAVIPPMPFVDAINFARFLVEVTVGYTRFLLGPDTVGGPVEIAGINRHEGFKWVSRKHYYSAELNPKDPHP